MGILPLCWSVDCTSSRIAPHWQPSERSSDEETAMDEEDLLPRQKRPAKKDLTPMAIAELEIYITELETEIARARDEISAKRKQRGGADALFKR
jgi:uncharacterized small protein (DUF1192 family)